MQPNITIIGAGAYIFPLRMVTDILSFPALRESHFCLMDIDADRLARTEKGTRQLVDLADAPAEVSTTLDRCEAVEGADFVIITWQVGGIEAYGLDVEIPRGYGLDQPIGDTLGPGGVFRGLRTIEALKDLCPDMLELCPGAVVMNYANPMAINTWASYELGVRSLGLCHSVQGTAGLLARHVGVPIDEVNYRAAGINHQAWYIQFEHQGRDLLPAIRERMMARHLPDGEDKDEREGLPYAGKERVRTEIMRLTGHFHSESSHHASEYTPWFRKDPETVQEYIPVRGDFYQHCLSHDDEGRAEQFVQEVREKGIHASSEYGARIVDSVVSGEPRVVHASVRNDGLIANLPQGCAVEVPVLVDGNGPQPTAVGDLPPACAAINRSNVIVQDLAVRAGLTGDRELVHAAVAMDPYTGATLTLPQIRKMVNRMFEAQARWLPSFG
jgi:alpha-galactosidase